MNKWGRKMVKKIVTVILILTMVFALCACGDIVIYQNDAGDAQSITKAAETISVPIATPTPTVEPTPSPIVVEASVANAEVSSEISTPAEPVYVTKNPYSECVYSGGNCTFIAYAANSTSVSWIIANRDGSEWYYLSSIMSQFPGIIVTGLGTSTITISNIPYELNGYKVQAKFEGIGGPVHTDFAYIWVNQPVPCWDVPFDYMNPYGNRPYQPNTNDRYIPEPWY